MGGGEAVWQVEIEFEMSVEMRLRISVLLRVMRLDLYVGLPKGLITTCTVCIVPCRRLRRVPRTGRKLQPFSILKSATMFS